MPITADKVKDLAQRGERTTLDYKVADYDWSRGKITNAELAKDVMSMANVLRADALAAHILIGVEPNGTIVGITTQHVDDADAHQKVASILNRSPDFVYGAVDVDGVSVGVYEIRPGGRPYFPRQNIGPLLENVATFRDGSSTKRATPTDITEWAYEDDALARKAQELGLRKLEAEREVHGQVTAGSMSNDASGVTIVLRIYNSGRSGFAIEKIEWTSEWTSRVYKEGVPGELQLEFPVGYDAPGESVSLVHCDLIPPAQVKEVPFSFSRADAIAHINKYNLNIAGWVGNWLAYHFKVHCRTDLGGVGVLHCTARQ